jgi:hypothetical protein
VNGVGTGKLITHERFKLILQGIQVTQGWFKTKHGLAIEQAQVILQGFPARGGLCEVDRGEIVQILFVLHLAVKTTP